MEIWLLLVLAANFFWAVAQNLIKKGLKNISPLWNNIFSNICRLLIWVPAVLLLSKLKINLPTFQNFFVIFVAACCYMFLFYALSKGKLALVAPVVATSPVFTVVLSCLFLREKLTYLQTAGLLLILVAGVLIALPEKGQIKEIKKLSWLLWGILTALLIGTGDFLTKLSTGKIGAYSHLFFLALVLQLLSAINFLIDKNGRQLPKFSKQNFLPTLLGIPILWIGSLMFFLSFDYGSVSLIVSTASFYPALTVILALIFLKEKINIKQGIGIILAVLGILLLAF